MKIHFSNSDAESDDDESDIKTGPDIESKYDDTDNKAGDDKELKLIVELERRGKVNPSSDQQRFQLIDGVHARGHFGRDMIYRTLDRDGYWWPGMRNTIQERIRECIPCLRYNISKQGFDPAISITAALPFDHIQIDHSTKLSKSTDGMTALMVIVDVCVGFVILRPLTNTQDSSVAPVLWQIFNDFGFPKVIQSDGGPEFVNRVIKEMIRLSGVPHRVITPYNPRADGKVERNIGIAMSIIKKHLHGVGKAWTAFVPWAQSCINNRISELTGSTPFSLMFGRKFNPFQDYTSSQPLETISESEWSKLQDRMMNVVYPSITDRISVHKERMVSRLRSRPSVSFRKGDIVMLRRSESIMGQPLGKFEAQYTGPYQIQSKGRNGAITLITPNGTPLPRLVRPHMLKFVSHSSAGFNKHYVVDRIIAHQGDGPEDPNIKYLVHWEGYSSKDDTWEPVESFDGDDAIKDYWDRQGEITTALRS